MSFPLLRALQRDRFFQLLIIVGVVLSLFTPFTPRSWPGAIDWHTIITLSGLMLLTKGVELSGYFDVLGRKMTRRFNTERQLAIFMVLAAAFLTNDVALFIVVPLTITLKKLCAIPVNRLIIFEALAVNAGSLLTPIGNPQNILMWGRSGLSFTAFTWQMAPLAGAMMLTLMVLCGTYLLLDGTLSLLMFVMFLIVGSRVFDPLTSALTNFAEFRYFSIAGGRILSLMEEPEMTGNRKAPENGDITLEGVSFAYRDKEVLHDVSLTLPQGSLTALVGPSGSGKSTLMKLCARFYDPQRGHVLFNGVRMDEIEPESLMRHISMVFQDVYLFQDTIRNNIRFGKADATDEQIVAAAKKACCHDFIMRLPKGYDTMVGEGGCTLSGGEKQRLSIARAILKDAQTILLDEATASLDPENEVEVQRAINTLIAGRTVIVIAHRLKTIRNADNIVVLDQGRIAEQGTHDQLVAHGGLYARLWAIQERTAGWSITS